MLDEPLFRHPHRIRFFEVDLGGTVFGGRVFEFFIDAFHSFLAARGYDLRRLKTSEWRFPMVHIEADFRVPMPFATELFVEIARIDFRNTSAELTYRLVGADDPTRVHCVGKTIHVFVDSTTYQKRAPPPEVLALLGVAPSP